MLVGQGWMDAKLLFAGHVWVGGGLGYLQRFTLYVPPPHVMGGLRENPIQWFSQISLYIWGELKLPLYIE